MSAQSMTKAQAGTSPLPEAARVVTMDRGQPLGDFSQENDLGGEEDF
jgi:hypothetical protein